MATLCCIVPSYNYGRFIEQALDGILAQTRPADEVIVCDDGSTDDTMGRLQQYAGRGASVRVVRNRINLGLAATRNRAIALTDCDYVVSIDADDWPEPAYFEKLANALDANPRVGISYSGVKVWVHDENRFWVDPTWPPAFTDETWTWMLKRSNPPNTCIPASAMYRREMWRKAGGFMESVKRGEDVEFWLRAMTRTGYRARKATNEALYVWRYHGNQLSHGIYPDVHTWIPETRKGRTVSMTERDNPFFQPLVSVVIPVGPGHETYAVSAIESVIGQTFPEWEVIVVNDTGNPELSEQLKARYPFAAVLSTSGACGASHARNTGLGAVASPYVVFLDADDFLHPFALQVFLDAYARMGDGGHGGYIYSDLFEYKGAGRDATANSRQLENDDHVTLACRNGITSLIRAEDARKVGGFDETMLRGWEDVDFYLKLRLAGVCGVRVAQPLYYYRVTGGHLRNASGEHREELEALIDSRYGAYKRGETPMAGCCGGDGGDELIRVKRALQGLPPVPGSLAVQEGQTRMQYIGKMQGTVTWIGKYRAGNNDSDRFIYVERGDVQRLTATGQFVIDDAPGTTMEPATMPLQPEMPEEAHNEFSTDNISAKATDKVMDGAGSYREEAAQDAIEREIEARTEVMDDPPKPSKRRKT